MEKDLVFYIADVLSEIISKNKSEARKTDFKDKIYQFNALDLLLQENVDIKRIAEVVKYRKSGIMTNSRYRNFNVARAAKTEILFDYLEKILMRLSNVELKTKYEYFIEGEIITPTEEQLAFVEKYLRDNNLPVNDKFFGLALRRLIVGGDINSKFEKDYLTNAALELKEKTEKVDNGNKI